MNLVVNSERIQKIKYAQRTLSPLSWSQIPLYGTICLLFA